MRSLRGLVHAVLVGCVVVLTSQAVAAPRPFAFTLRVGDVIQAPEPACLGGFQPTFLCDNAPGDVHVGLFFVDSGLLSREGDGLRATVSNFFLRINDFVWDQRRGVGIAAFRATEDGFPDACCILTDSDLSFDVHGGRITGLRGGVAGPADATFVDFPPLGGSANSFVALDSADTRLTGSLSVLPLAEPEGVFLFAAGLLAWGASMKCSLSRKAAHRCEGSLIGQA